MLLAAACAHGPRRGTLESLKPAVETFHQRVRWKDYRGAAELLVPERREAFQKAVRSRNDERDLSITDYELEEARLSADGRTAWVESRLSWVRLPSVTERSEVITSEYVFLQGAWWLARQDAGPFAAELEAPYTPPPANDTP